MWKENNRKKVYEKANISLYQIDYTNPNGTQTKRHLLDLDCDAVLIIPKRSLKEYILCHQYRNNVEKRYIEFPNGGVNKGEASLEAARRELIEETSLDADLTKIGEFLPLGSIVDMKVHVYEATNLREPTENFSQDEYESIQIQTYTEDQLNTLIKKGDIFDAYTLSALTLYKNYVTNKKI